MALPITVIPPTYIPTREELVIRRPGRPGQRWPGLRMDIVELLNKTGKAYTARAIMVKFKLPESRYASVRTTLWQLVRQGRLKKDPKLGYRSL